MAVWLLSGDLMIGSQVAGAAARQDAVLQTYGSADALLAATTQQAPTTVIVDLSTPGVDLVVLVQNLKAIDNPPRVIAFGPHVHAAKLAAARQAGCDDVLSRGALHDRVDQLVRDAG